MLTRYFSICLIVLSLSAVAAKPASADTHDLGTLTSTYSYTDVFYKSPSDTKFTDIFTFTVPENYTADITSWVKDLKLLGPFFETKKLSLGGLDEALIDTSSSGKKMSYSALAAGDYTFDVTGQSRGWFGGIYKLNLAATLTPVPEPATIAMLLAGLGLVLTTARRRTAMR